MSIEALNLVWRHSKSTLGARLVLLSLADFANDNLQSWPAVSTLAEKSKLSERNTRLCLRKLESDGELRCLKNQGPKGCNVYQITIAPGQSLPPEKSDIPGGKIEQSPGAKIAPKPSGRTIIDPSKKNAAVAADPRFEDFQKLWADSYKAKTQRNYLFTDKDGAALKKLLKLTTMTAGELADLAWKAWQCSGSKFFYCKQSKSVAWFCDKFNSIVAELDAGGIAMSARPAEEEDQTLYHPPGWKPA